jgi:hypothetical protein
VYWQRNGSVWAAGLWLAVSIVIIIIIIIITFMHGIYNYIPETKHVSAVYSVAAVLYLQFVLHVMLFRPSHMFCTFTLALPAVCVQCPFIHSVLSDDRFKASSKTIPPHSAI